MTRTWPAALALITFLGVGPAAGIERPTPAPTQGAVPVDSADTAGDPELAPIRLALQSGHARPGDIIARLKDVLGRRPELAEAHFLLGLTYRLVGRDMLAEAVAELRQALTLDPSLTAARYYLAQSYLDLGRADRAREELERALDEQGDRPTEFLLLLTRVETQAGSPARALDLAREVLAADPDRGEARYFAALALIALDRRAEGIAELEQLAATDMVPPDVMAALGSAYLDDGRPADAVPLLEQAVAAAVGRPDLHVRLARALRLTGQIEAADARLAAALPPGTPLEASEYYETAEADIAFETALVRLAQDRLDDADEALQKAVTLRPGHGPTLRHLAELRLRQERRTDAARYAAAARSAGETLTPELASLLDAPGDAP